MTRRRPPILAAAIALCAAGVVITAQTPIRPDGQAALSARPDGQAAPSARRAGRTPDLPARLSDADFWRLASESSEPDGYFRITDNFTSNENEIGTLFSRLRDQQLTGDVYLGVGPEQNFTYIAAIEPSMAFILDIRRQAAMQHLMFKALFEMARDRAEFLSLLFARPRPGDLDETTPVDRLLTAYFPVAPDATLRTETRDRIFERLTGTHGFELTANERLKLDAVYYAFVQYGPGITTRGAYSGRGSQWTFADLTGWSTDAARQAQSFLSTEAHFRTVKSLQERNLIVPVTGDFGGAKALRAVGTWVRDRGGVIRAFYVSNVEQYLFQDSKAHAFYENVRTLPLDERSVFIRPYALRGFRTADAGLCSITAFLAAEAAGRVRNHDQALACGR
ncbi:MAG: hypothetical protein R2752_14175 [Vicinamibacterales bacterium]